jgi:hypothetical protein
MILTAAEDKMLIVIFLRDSLVGYIEKSVKIEEESSGCGGVLVK